jgi:hypothetical protein
MNSWIKAAVVAVSLIVAGGAQAQTQPASPSRPATPQTTAPQTTTPQTGTAAPTTPAPAKKKTTPQPTAQAKPGGGPGLVWTNPDSKVYHCQGSRWYGRTKQGEYMTEAAAKTAGYHASQNKACSSSSS